MTPQTKRVVAGIVLTLVPIFTIRNLKQTAWGSFLATPKSRQLGDPKAPILLVEYADFECPMCARVQPILHQFMDIYKGKVRLASKFFPLTRIHKNAMPAAQAAECAAEQDKFWPYQDQLYATQLQWASLQDPTTSFMAIAQGAHLDTTAFTACLADASKQDIIEQDANEGKARDISATPTLFVGDERLVGTMIETDGARTIEKEFRRR